MFRIVFTALDGGEREVVFPAASARDAVLAAATRRDFGLVISCTKLDTIEDWAVMDRRSRLKQRAA